MEDNNNYNEVNDDYEIKDAPLGGNGEFFDQEDIEKNKVIAGLSYLWILFFLPLVACPDSKFGRFHANQALVLFIISTAGSLVLGIIPILGWILLPFFGIACFVFMILGMINGFTGKAKELPLIGTIKILK